MTPPVSNAPTSNDDADPLTRVLPRDSDGERPWLVWYAQSERIELTGHVVRMWAAKTAGMLAAEAGPQPAVHLDLPVGWRAVTWAAGTWLAGGSIVLTTQPERSSDLVSVASTPAGLLPGSEVQVLVPTASLAVRWTGPAGADLPPLALDGAADLMTYPDRFTPAAADPQDPALVLAPTLVAPQDPTFVGVRSMSRSEVAERALSASTGLRGARAVLVAPAPGDLTDAVLGVLAAWAAGATAVLLDPGADQDMAAAAARQEGAVPR